MGGYRYACLDWVGGPSRVRVMQRRWWQRLLHRFWGD